MCPCFPLHCRPSTPTCHSCHLVAECSPAHPHKGPGGVLKAHSQPPCTGQLLNGMPYTKGRRAGGRVVMVPSRLLVHTKRRHACSIRTQADTPQHLGALEQPQPSRGLGFCAVPVSRRHGQPQQQHTLPSGYKMGQEGHPIGGVRHTRARAACLEALQQQHGSNRAPSTATFTMQQHCWTADTHVTTDPKENATTQADHVAANQGNKEHPSSHRLGRWCR